MKITTDHGSIGIAQCQDGILLIAHHEKANEIVPLVLTVDEAREIAKVLRRCARNLAALDVATVLVEGGAQ
jgi:hypothetical protein